MGVMARNDGKSSASDRIEPSMALMANPTMSRRGFFSLAAAAGALAFIGCVMTSERTMVAAYADEADRIHFSVYILGRDELPVLCYDMTDADNKVPVEGMQVTIASLNNKETLTVTTDADGFATARIRPLSQQADNDSASRYTLYGSVAAAKDGYRQLHYPETYLSSGTLSTEEGLQSYVLEIPTHPIADGDLYLRTAALDNNDVQYCDADCAVGSTNTIDHAFEVEVIGPEGKQVDVEVYYMDTGTCATTTWGKATLTASGDNPTSYSAVFTGPWLKEATVGGMLKVKFALQGKAALVMTSPVKFVAAKSTMDDARGDLSISPGTDSDSKADTCPIPNWIFEKGDTFTAALPWLPVEFFVDDFGYFGFSVTLLQYTFLRKKDGQNDLEDGDKFRHVFGGYSKKRAWNEFKDGVQDSWGNFGDTLDDALDNNRTFGSAPFTTELEASFSLQVMGYAAWEEDEYDLGEASHWLGNVSLAPTFGIDFSLTKQCICIVPFYFVVDLSAEVQAEIALGFTFEQGFKNWKWAYEFFGIPVAVLIYITVEAGLSIAAGVAGIAGIGIRGGGLFYTGFEFTKKEGQKFPHIYSLLRLTVRAFVQLLFVKKSWTIYQFPEWDLYDNWTEEEKEEKAQSLMSRASFMATYGTVDMSDGTLVTADELAFTADYAAVAVPVESNESGQKTSLMSATATGADDEPGYILKFTRLKKGGSKMRVMAADADPAFESPYDKTGATAYNPLRGLKPTYLHQLFTDGYSNSRMKVIHGYAPCVDDGSDNQPIMAARLVTVDITDTEGGSIHSVTRVAFALWDYDTHAFGDEKVVEASIQPSGYCTWERYDVDFDVVLLPEKALEAEGMTCVAYFAITSMVLPEEDTAEAYEQSQYVSFVGWCPEADSEYNQSPMLRYTRWSLSDLSNHGYYTSGPRILAQPYLGSEDPQYCPAEPYIYYYKTDISTGKTTLNVTSAHYYGTNADGGRTVDDVVLIEELPDGLSSEDFRHGSLMAWSPDKGKLVADGDKRYWTTVVLGWKGCNSSLPSYQDTEVAGAGAPYSFMRSARIGSTGEWSYQMVGKVYKYVVDMATATVTDIGLPNVSSLNRCLLSDEDIPFMWHDDADKDAAKPRQVARFDSGSCQLTSEKALGGSKFNQYFQSHDGKWLYTVRVIKQEVPGLSDDARAAKAAGAKVYSEMYKDDDSYGDLGDVTLEGGQVEAYVLMEARWLAGLGYYSEFYPIAQLDSCPDNIDVVEHADGRRDFVFSTIGAVDKADTTKRYDLDGDYEADDVYHSADIYHVAVPQALGLHVKDLKVVTTFAAPGENVYLLVELANIGNWFITGFVVDFYGPDCSFIATTSFDDLQNRVQDTHDNYTAVRDEDGSYVYDDNGNMTSKKSVSKFDEVGILPPGTTRTYRIEFTIPEDQATGAKTDFSLQIRAPFCSMSALRADYFSESDLTVGTSLVYVDPNIHGLPSSGYDSAERVWNFESVGAPYTKEGEDPQPEPISYEITSHPSSVTAKAGDAVTMCVAATGATAYQWQHSRGGAIWSNTKWEGYDTGTLSFKMLDALDGRQWRCVVTFANNSQATSDAATTTLQRPAGTIVSQPSDCWMTAGSLAEMSVKVEGDVATYGWQHSKDGIKWSNTAWATHDQATFLFAMLAALDERQWRCVVTFTDGTQVVSDAAKTVLITPYKVNFRTGDSVALNAQAPEGATDFQWQHSRDGGASWHSTKWSGYNTDEVSFKMLAALDGRYWRCQYKLADGRTAYSVVVQLVLID